MAPLLAAKFKSSRPYARSSEPVATACWSFLSIHSSGRCLTLGILQEAAEEEASDDDRARKSSERCRLQHRWCEARVYDFM